MKPILLGCLVGNIIIAGVNFIIGAHWAYMAFNLVCALLCWVGYESSI